MAVLNICQCEYIISMAARHSFNMERFFQALGDNTRLRLLNLMRDQEICVCYFVEILEKIANADFLVAHQVQQSQPGVVSQRLEKALHVEAVPGSHGNNIFALTDI